MRPMKTMTIAQARRLTGCDNEFQLAKLLGVTYQAVQYWRNRNKSILPHPWPEVVRAKANGGAK